MIIEFLLMSSYYNLFKYTVYGLTFGYHALTYYKYLEYSYQFYCIFRWFYEKNNTKEKEPLKLKNMTKNGKENDKDSNVDDDEDCEISTETTLEETHKINITSS
jgi:hypothetical protein